MGVTSCLRAQKTRVPCWRTRTPSLHLRTPAHHHELAELCRRPAYLNKHDQERPLCTSVHPRTTMSWQSYVDDQLISTNMIKNAVIAGHDGNIWASSAGFNVTAAELKVILDRYSSTDQLAMNGV